MKLIGTIKNIIFAGDNGYTVGLFKVKECNEKEYINKTITFTGFFNNTNEIDKYELSGEFITHKKFGKQFQVDSYEKILPTTKENIIEFLSSSIIKGIGRKTAIKIVDKFGDNTLNIIKNNYQNLLLIPGISEEKALNIYNSIKEHDSNDELLMYLKNFGFTVKEALKLINKFGNNIKAIVEGNVYELKNIFDFKRLDQIFLKNYERDNEIRIVACIIQTFNILQNNLGDTKFLKGMIFNNFIKLFKLDISDSQFDIYLNLLLQENKIVSKDNYYSLKETYNYEENIALSLKNINMHKIICNNDLNKVISSLEEYLNIKYNDDQKNAIVCSLQNNISIITGGPGTGKTTIINGIVKTYIEVNRLNHFDTLNQIALLAPTGRAAKRMSLATNMQALTIHRFLKWNKEKNEFGINRFNKNKQKLIIVDEVSMVDTFLFYSLLEGLESNIKIIFVGDYNQLPSVSCGNILKDLIDSKKFNHVNLETIYRQKENSYIPYLAREIRIKELGNYTTMKDDYNYLEVNSMNLREMIKKICLSSIKKGLNEKNLQILIPMYKGPNGIDNINLLLRDIFNKKDSQKEYLYNEIVYRENDKVLQLVNNPDANVFNGDIGYIENIYEKNKDNFVLSVNFDGNVVDYKKNDLSSLKHAYAITIHKSQGSEFDHVILPIISSYKRMLYNKLIYTGVSRAKKSLIILGENDCFKEAVMNDYSVDRNTNLKEFLCNKK